MTRLLSFFTLLAGLPLTAANGSAVVGEAVCSIR